MTPQSDEAKINKMVGGLIKGKLGKSLLGFSIVNNLLTVTGGLLVAVAAPVPAALAITAGIYRMYNAVSGHVAMSNDPEAAMKKVTEADKNMGYGERLLKQGLGLAFGVGVLATGITLLATIGHFGFLAGAGALLLGGKMTLGGLGSTVVHSLGAIKAAFTGGSSAAAEANDPAPAPAPQAPAPQPTVAPTVTTQPAVTPQFEAAATPAATDKAPEAPAVKVPNAKPPAPPQA